MFKNTVHIAGRPVGPDHPPYIVAELSANHAGSLDKALEMVDAAADTGVDAVKLQTYRADTITLDSDRPEFFIDKGPRKGMRLYDLYVKAHTPWEWHAPLFARAHERGVACFSSPFDFTAVDLLEDLDAPAYKIASFELVDIPLIRRACRTGRPVIMSTGMADQKTIQEAVQACADAGNDQVVLLHCVSGYPTPVEDTNLSTLTLLREKFACPFGLSDHTLSVETSIGAVALGACFIEKHFVLDRESGVIDAAFSLEPQEFKELVRATRSVWSAMGSADFHLKKSEQFSSRLRRSLYAVEDIPAGAPLTMENVRSVRPNNGLAPKHLDEVLTRTARVDIAKHTPLGWELLSGGPVED